MKLNQILPPFILSATIFAAGPLFSAPAPTVEESGNRNDPTAIEQLGKSLVQFPRLVRRGALVTPESSTWQPEDVGVRAHTNHLFVAMAVAAGPQGETPQSLRSVYSLPATGGAGVIAIVDAFHYPTALNDFNVFASQFKLPTEPSATATSSLNKVFQVVYAKGTQPATDGGWSEEAALDIEWAHAMAPNAKIVLVEAASNSNADLYAAVDVASNLPGVREVSMSWGSSENSTEAQGDVHFTKAGVVYFAASGDTGGNVNYPGCSPYVTSAGGTSINRSTTGAFVSESGWSGSGGGLSSYETMPSFQSGIASLLTRTTTTGGGGGGGGRRHSRFEARPSFQDSVASVVGQYRGVPDLSFDADPNTGVSVYDSTAYEGVSGWLVFGGTSVASPSLAGIINNAASAPGGSFAASTAAELTNVYSHLGQSNFATMFRDITQGKAGGNQCVVGWDFVTGVGSCIGLAGK